MTCERHVGCLLITEKAPIGNRAIGIVTAATVVVQLGCAANLRHRKQAGGDFLRDLRTH